MNAFSKHLSLEDLVDIAEKSTAERGQNAAHLNSCVECAATLRRLEHAFILMKSDKAENAPRDVLQRAIAVFPPLNEKPSLVRRVMAILSFDSLNQPAAFATRSGQSAARQLIYSIDNGDIDLHISNEDNNNWVVTGQLLGKTCGNGSVEIVGESIVYSSALSESCEFKLPAVPSGKYCLRLRLSDLEVEVPRLELGK